MPWRKVDSPEPVKNVDYSGIRNYIECVYNMVSVSKIDDAVMLASRVFTQLITPYLVLHGDDGEPTALIRLQDLQIIDYSKLPGWVDLRVEPTVTNVAQITHSYS